MIATAIIALVISVITIGITIWNVSRTNQLTRKNHQSNIFCEYTKRYMEIMKEKPASKILNAGMNNPDVRKYMSLYFDLCSEEFHLHKKGYIPDDIWSNWVEGMRFTMKPQIYQTCWIAFSSSYNEDFIHFMHQEIFNHSKK